MPAEYTITNIVPRKRTNPSGGFMTVQEVTFTTAGHNQTGIIDVPGDNPSAQEVRAAVAARAANIESTFEG